MKKKLLFLTGIFFSIHFSLLADIQSGGGGIVRVCRADGGEWSRDCSPDENCIQGLCVKREWRVNGSECYSSAQCANGLCGDPQPQNPNPHPFVCMSPLHNPNPGEGCDQLGGIVYCGPEQVCRVGEIVDCVNYLKAGDLCLSGGESTGTCAPGSVCVAESPAPGIDIGICQPQFWNGSKCNSHLDCIEGYCDSAQGLCAFRPMPGSECDLNMGCEKGVCEPAGQPGRGKCVLTPAGEPCSSGRQCFSEVCMQTPGGGRCTVPVAGSH